MKLHKISPNCTEIVHQDKTVLFSYSTPVACHISGIGFARTEKNHSRTTSKHIGTWLKLNGAYSVSVKPQAFFDSFL